MLTSANQALAPWNGSILAFLDRGNQRLDQATRSLDARGHALRTSPQRDCAIYSRLRA